MINIVSIFPKSVCVCEKDRDNLWLVGTRNASPLIKAANLNVNLRWVYKAWVKDNACWVDSSFKGSILCNDFGAVYPKTITKDYLDS